MVGGVTGEGVDGFVYCSSSAAALYEYFDTRDLNSFEDAGGSAASISSTLRFAIGGIEKDRRVEIGAPQEKRKSGGGRDKSLLVT